MIDAGICGIALLLKICSTEKKADFRQALAGIRFTLPPSLRFFYTPWCACLQTSSAQPFAGNACSCQLLSNADTHPLSAESSPGCTHFKKPRASHSISPPMASLTRHPSSINAGAPRDSYTCRCCTLSGMDGSSIANGERKRNCSQTASAYPNPAAGETPGSP